MDESQNCDHTRSLNKSGTGEYRSTNTNHEAPTSRNDDFEDTPNDIALDSEGFANATTSQTLQIPSRNKPYLSQGATTYELDKFSKNLMLVFVMFELLDEKSTYGRKMDVLTLTKCFEQRCFTVIVYENKTKTEICTIFDNLILEDLSDFGCLAVVFLTHSKGNGILLTTDGEIRVGDIIEYLTGLKAPSLVTKPKILIFQTFPPDTAIDGPSKNRDIPYEMANETDFLMLYSTYSWMKFHEGKIEGSPFIQSFCKFICDSDPDDNIFSIIPHVIENVSISYGDGTKKQVPIMTSTLSRKLCFNTRNDVPLSRYCTDSVEKTTGLRTHPPEAVSIQEYGTEDFRLKYFEYVRDLLNYFVETRRQNCPSAEQAIGLLNIAKTIDCSQSLSLLRDQTCIQIMKFLEEQDFDEKKHMFCHKY